MLAPPLTLIGPIEMEQRLASLRSLRPLETEEGTLVSGAGSSRNSVSRRVEDYDPMELLWAQRRLPQVISQMIGSTQ